MKNTTIFRYPLNRHSLTTIVSLPEGAQILTALMRQKIIYLWAVIDLDPSSSKQERKFEVIGTGRTFGETGSRRYISTIQHGSSVWHVFERE